MKGIYSKAFRDIFSPDVLYFVIKMNILALILSIVPLIFFWDTLHHIVEGSLNWIGWEWAKENGASLILYLFAYMFFLIMLSLVTSLFSEKILIQIAKKHYPTRKVVGSSNILTSISIILKASFTFILLFILCIPLLFTPILGQVLMLYLWSILLKNPTVYEVGSLFIHHKETLKEKRKKTTTLAMVASLFNYIPLLNFLAPLFSQILFLHHILKDENV